MLGRWESRANRERREAAEVQARQDARACTPGMRLDDPIPSPELDVMKRTSAMRAMASVLIGWAIAIIYGHDRIADFHWLTFGLGFLFATPFLWMATAAAWMSRIRAQRHLDGRDPVYWKPFSEDRSDEGDTRPRAVWYQVADRPQALHDASKDIGLMIWGVVAYGLVIGFLIYGMPWS